MESMSFAKVIFSSMGSYLILEYLLKSSHRDCSSLLSSVLFAKFCWMPVICFCTRVNTENANPTTILVSIRTTTISLMVKACILLWVIFMDCFCNVFIGGAVQCLEPDAMGSVFCDGFNSDLPIFIIVLIGNC